MKKIDKKKIIIIASCIILMSGIFGGKYFTSTEYKTNKCVKIYLESLKDMCPRLDLLKNYEKTRLGNTSWIEDYKIIKNDIGCNVEGNECSIITCKVKINGVNKMCLFTIDNRKEDSQFMIYNVYVLQ